MSTPPVFLKYSVSSRYSNARFLMKLYFQATKVKDKDWVSDSKHDWRKIFDLRDPLS